MQERLEKEDEILVSLAGLKQVLLLHSLTFLCPSELLILSPFFLLFILFVYCSFVFLWLFYWCIKPCDVFLFVTIKLIYIEFEQFAQYLLLWKFWRPQIKTKEVQHQVLDLSHAIIFLNAKCTC